MNHATRFILQIFWSRNFGKKLTGLHFCDKTKANETLWSEVKITFKTSKLRKCTRLSCRTCCNSTETSLSQYQKYCRGLLSHKAFRALNGLNCVIVLTLQQGFTSRGNEIIRPGSLMCFRICRAPERFNPKSSCGL